MPALSTACNSQCWSMAVFLMFQDLFYNDTKNQQQLQESDPQPPASETVPVPQYGLGTSSPNQNPYLLSPDVQTWHFWNTYLLKLKSFQRKWGVLLWFALMDVCMIR